MCVFFPISRVDVVVYVGGPEPRAWLPRTYIPTVVRVRLLMCLCRCVVVVVVLVRCHQQAVVLGDGSRVLHYFRPVVEKGGDVPVGHVVEKPLVPMHEAQVSC